MVITRLMLFTKWEFCSITTGNAARSVLADALIDRVAPIAGKGRRTLVMMIAYSALALAVGSNDDNYSCDAPDRLEPPKPQSH
eukprot:1013939-Amphidinium_carterae.1